MAVVVKDLSFSYSAGSKQVLRDVSFDIERGSRLVMVRF